MNLDLIHAIEKMGNVKIRIKGENLHVDGWLNLSGCTSLTELPDNLHVGGSLARDKKRAEQDHFKRFDRDNNLNKTQKQ